MMGRRKMTKRALKRWLLAFSSSHARLSGAIFLSPFFG
jgi:hypothetical protein